MEKNTITLANQAAITRLLKFYLGQPNCAGTWLVADATIYCRQISNRTGLPDDAVTYRYWMEHPEWQLEVRAVWRGGELHQPVGIHCAILGYHPGEFAAVPAPEEALKEAVNDWLRGAL